MKQPKPKSMLCKLMVRGGHMSKRRPNASEHLYFERMVTVEQVGMVIQYLAQFPEPK